MYKIAHNIVMQEKYSDNVKFIEIFTDTSGENNYPILFKATYENGDTYQLPMDIETFGFIFNQALLNNMINCIDSEFKFDTILEVDIIFDEQAYPPELMCKHVLISRNTIQINQIDDGAVVNIESFYASTDDVLDEIEFEKSKSVKITLTKFEIMQLIKFYVELKNTLHS